MHFNEFVSDQIKKWLYGIQGLLKIPFWAAILLIAK
jgi:hypothetical protein